MLICQNSKLGRCNALVFLFIKGRGGLTIYSKRGRKVLKEGGSKMLTLLFTIMMIGVFGRLAGAAFRLSWGLGRGLLTLIFLPGIIIAGFVMGLLRLAFPLLLIAGIFSLFAPAGRIGRGGNFYG